MDFFRKKLLSCHAQQSCLTKAASVSGNTQFPSYKAAYRLVRCKKPHTVAEELILPSATDMVSTIIDETAASKLKAMPLSETTKSPLMLPLQWLVHFFFFSGGSYAFDFPKLSQNTNLSYVCSRVTFVASTFKSDVFQFLFSLPALPPHSCSTD